MRHEVKFSSSPRCVWLPGGCEGAEAGHPDWACPPCWGPEASSRAAPWCVAFPWQGAGYRQCEGQLCHVGETKRG